MQEQQILGIDVGASGIKGAIIDVSTGELLTERLRLETPKPATPDSMAETVAELTKALDYKGNLIGVGFPAIVKNGKAQTAANIDPSWIGADIEASFGKSTGKKVVALNDADAAGLACVKFGVGKGVKGTLILITIGSGLGSALFTNGRLVHNTEFGHIHMNGMIAEHYASSNTRKKEDLSWEEWGARFNEYLHHIERILSPDLILLGGGASKKFELYDEVIDVNTAVKPAELKNTAGSIGAAYYAWKVAQKKKKKKKK
ncbi:MAG: ROK family protein [Bacteroidetes bacterium]|nr:ROK family protein [Bacteroidota bacterium]